MTTVDKTLEAISVIEKQCQVKVAALEADEEHLKLLLAEAEKLVEELKTKDQQLSRSAGVVKII